MKKQKSNIRVFSGGRMLFALVSVMVLICSFAVYAWFIGDIRTSGATVSTGKIDITFRTYKYYESVIADSNPEETGSGDTFAEKGLRRYIDESIVNPSSIELENSMQENVGILGNAGTDDLYLVVRKNEGSIPLDIEYLFELIGVDGAGISENSDEALAYAGGFCYRLKDITSVVAGTSPDESLLSVNIRQGSADNTVPSDLLERKLYAYISEANRGTAGYLNDASSNLLTDIGNVSSDNRSSSLRTGDFCVYRLTVTLNGGASSSVLYQGCSFELGISLMVAQSDGLDSYGNSQTYYISSEAELNGILPICKPGDSVVLKQDIDCYGDLNITKPLNLYLNYNGGCKLTVHGNLNFTYPYNDAFTVNTDGNGQLNVVKRDNSGGNLSIDTPNCSFSLIGSGNTDEGKADINVQGRITANCSCAPESDYENTGYSYGLIINRSRICLAGGVEGENAPLNRIYLMNATQLTVGYNTRVGQIQAFTDYDESGKMRKSVERISIINYGTVAEQIILSDMLENTDGRFTVYGSCPQIFIHNYGTISQAITLPGWSSVFTGSSGNTRMIIEMAASEILPVGSSDFLSEDIERISISALVVDISGEKDNSELLVHYTDDSEESASAVSLYSLLTDYFAENSCDFQDIVRLKVVTYGDCRLTKSLTDSFSDYATLRRLTNLRELDISDAITEDNTVPSNAFLNMQSLKILQLPKTAVTIQDSIVSGTQVIDLYIPDTVVTLSDSSLDGVRGVHVLNDTRVFANLRKGSDGSTRYIFVSPLKYPEYAQNSNYSKFLGYLHTEATFDSEQLVYYRIVSDTDAEIACYTGASLSENGGSYIQDFRYDKFRISGTDRDYAIVKFDDYAFCGKIDGLTTAVDITFSDRLTSIGSSAFQNCTGIGSVVFNRSSDNGNHRNIASCAFEGCSNISGELVLNNVYSLGDGAFRNCDKITSVIADELVNCGNEIFRSCDSLEKAYCPKLSYHTGYAPYGGAFSFCPKLAVLETGWLTTKESYVGRTIADSFNLQLWLIHTENTVNTLFSQNLIQLNTSDTSAYKSLNIMIDGTDITGGSTMYNKFKSVLSYNYNTIVVNTEQFTADKYLYACENRYDGSSGTVFTRRNFGTDTEQRYLCDLGYGDYIYALDDSGNAVLLFCTFESITGDYTVPEEFTDASGIHPVVAVGNNAYRNVKFVNTRLGFGQSLVKIGAECFYNRDGIISTIAEPFDLVNIGTLGDYAFYGCDGLQAVYSDNLHSSGGYIFSGCSNLYKAVLPKLYSILGNNYYNGFSNCPKLAVLETSALYNPNGYIGRTITGCNNIRLWLVHTEGVSDIKFQSQLIRLDTKNVTDTKPIFIMIDGKPYSNGKSNFNNFSGIISYSFGHDTGDTGIYTADCYRYAEETRFNSETGTQIERRNFGTESNPVYLSDLGYGDYVYAVDADGNAVLLFCALDAITGDYTVPASFTDADGTHPVVAIGNSAYRQVNFSNTHLSFPDSVKKIDSYCFYNLDGIVSSVTSPLNLNKTEELGSYAFYDCDSIAALNAPVLSTSGIFVFYSCDSLCKAVCPKLSYATSGSDFNGFAMCPDLAVLETGYMIAPRDYIGRMVLGSNNLKLWIIHSENGKFSAECGQFIHLGTPDTNAVKALSVLTDSFTPFINTTVYSSIASKIGYAYNTSVYNTGSFTANNYLYTDDPRYGRNSAVITRRNYGSSQSPFILSDIGYGDYVYALDEYGNATILCCTFESITGDYTVPGYLDGHPVTAIGHNAYRTVSFAGGATLTIPDGIRSVGSEAFAVTDGMPATAKDFMSVILPESVISIGNMCFGNCFSLTSVHIFNLTSLIEASNVISSAANYTPTNGITVYVNTYSYENIYVSDRWGNLPRSCFAKTDVVYTPVEGGATFYLSQINGCEYEITYVIDGNVSELVLPSYYYPQDADLYPGGYITSVTSTALSSLKNASMLQILELPEKLNSFTVRRSDISPTLREFRISQDNMYFSSDGGILFNKSKSVLISVPRSYNCADGCFEIPQSVSVVAEGALLGNQTIRILTVGGTGTVFSSGAIQNCSLLEEIIISTGSVTVLSGSAVSDCRNFRSIVCREGSELIIAGNEAVKNCRADFYISVNESDYEKAIANTYLDADILSVIQY